MRLVKFKPGEIDHIIRVEDTWECLGCGERYVPRKRVRFGHRHKWKRKHVKCGEAKAAE